MTNRSLFIVGTAAWITLLAPVGRAADQELPKAEAMMDRYIEVTGGKAAYEKRRSEVATIEMEFVGRGIKGTLTRYSNSSNNTYSTGELEGVGKLEEGVYNGQGWENTAIMGPRLKTGPENADSVRESTFNSALNWRSLYKAQTVGLEKCGEEDCYRVQLTPLQEGKPQTMFFSKSTGLLLKVNRTVVSPMGEMTVEVAASDYKPYNGILQPSKMVQTVMGNQISLTIVSVKTNEEIPKERFEPPAEIQKLMKK